MSAQGNRRDADSPRWHDQRVVFVLGLVVVGLLVYVIVLAMQGRR